MSQKTANHENRVRDDRQIIGRTQSCGADRLELGIPRLQGDGGITVSRALFEPGEIGFCGTLAIWRAGKK